MTKSRVGSLLFLAFSILYFYKSFNIRLLPGTEYQAMNAITFPYYIGILSIITALTVLILSFVKVETEDLFDWEYLKKFDFKKGFYFVLAMLFYGFTIRSLGFIIATILFLIIGFKILETKSWKVILLTSFGVSIIFWILLTQVLGVYIEQGVVLDYLIGDQL